MRSPFSPTTLAFLVLVCLPHISLADQLAASQPDKLVQEPPKDALNDPLQDGVIYRLGTTRLRHWVVGDLRFTPDSKRLVSSGWTPECLVWDVATGRQVRALLTSFPTAISPDARL